MAQNLLAEFRDGQEVELSAPASALHPDSAFQSEVDAIKGLLERVDQLTATIRKQHKAQMGAVTPEDQKMCQQEVEKSTQQAHSLAQQAKSKLRVMKDTVEDLESQADDPNTVRIKRTQFGTLSHEFLDAMERLNKTQAKCKQEHREKIRRQAKIVAQKDMNDEEIDEMVERGGGGQVYTQELMHNAKVFSAYEDIREKHAELRKLEKSIEEVAQLFRDVATLIDSQGEIIGRIDYQVSQTNQHVEKANEQLRKANKSQQSSRKTQCCLLILLLVVLLFLFGGIFF